MTKKNFNDLLDEAEKVYQDDDFAYVKTYHANLRMRRRDELSSDEKDVLFALISDYINKHIATLPDKVLFYSQKIRQAVCLDLKRIKNGGRNIPVVTFYPRGDQKAAADGKTPKIVIEGFEEYEQFNVEEC